MAASEKTSAARPVRTARNRGGRATPPPSPDPAPQDPGQLSMLSKVHEFFRICDVEDKGFITRPDMQRLHGELPLSLEELEKVFDTLDADGNGSLSLEEFTTGFSQFLSGESLPLNEGCEEHTRQLHFESVYQSKWEESLRKEQDDEDLQFYNLVDSLGANRVLEDETHIKKLWKQLRKDEPDLLPHFEELLARIFSQLHEANAEKNEIENALKKKIATYDGEIQNLYEEMEQQIKKEKEQFLLQDTEKFQTRSQELEQKLLSKEEELEQLGQKQKQVEKQCLELSNDKQETKVENEKLKQRNNEMRRELERTSQELVTAQQQLRMLQEEASQLHEAREMEVYRVSESLQREKTTLLKQLDLLREMNKHLRDERDSCLQKSKTNSTKSFWKQRSGSIIGKYMDRKQSMKSQSSEDEEVFSKTKNGSCTSADNDTEGGTSPNRALRRVISIEEDDVPQLLDTQLERSLNKWTEEEEKEQEDTPSSPRGQPVGKETWTNEEQLHSVPDRLFKIVFVGNSSVGKTSFLRRFCEDNFHSGTSATVGIDYSVKTVTVDKCQVALQLWDTAGQERYRSITKQFFRKADGVIVMYDVTARPTFTAVRQWLVSVQEGAGDNLPILLLGNKTDIEKEREVPNGLGEQLAKDCNLIFYECSACTGHNAKESVLHLARLLKEREDKEREKTIQLLYDSKKKSCCSRQ
ncbi:EF-hand calcium-binding domain-containing protein 4B [Rhinatrema bivittatum]|uniref:EF-hand calcium-binding domain-containing protein 4B n=1 Tax=Rhinatrema bivittatum TaxID=194408 RepID=UPI00112D4CE4|nr:EF-hand calcium-binding domain-containing protein 4B [Rhinatrema bivittatum]XP_029453176.1 EF-hand calcium-binding domain-containing protein 4B [Rhinatrema bivittatum]